jgi:transposase
MDGLMGESVGTDSIGGRVMPTAYSKDIRARVIARVEGGGSRREAAEHFEVSPSTAVKWVARFRQTGDCAAKPRGGSTSPLEKYADILLELVAEQPDLTLDEVECVVRKRKIPGSRTALWRFFARHKITFKKKPARNGAEARRRGAGTPTLDPRARYA